MGTLSVLKAGGDGSFVTFEAGRADRPFGPHIGVHTS